MFPFALHITLVCHRYLIHNLLFPMASSFIKTYFPFFVSNIRSASLQTTHICRPAIVNWRIWSQTKIKRKFMTLLELWAIIFLFGFLYVTIFCLRCIEWTGIERNIHIYIRVYIWFGSLPSHGSYSRIMAEFQPLINIIVCCLGEWFSVNVPSLNAHIHVRPLWFSARQSVVLEWSSTGHRYQMTHRHTNHTEALARKETDRKRRKKYR